MMAEETPQPLPGIDRTPRLLAYEIARACEAGKVRGIIALVIDSDEVWHVETANGIPATDLAFAALILQKEALELSLSGDSDEEEADSDDQA